MKVFEVLFSRTGALALFFLAVLSACTVVVEDDEGPRPRPPRPGPEYCSRDYQPVCARRRGDRQTFTNACMAERAGYRVISFGACRGREDDEDERFCTREYRPVCATAGNVLQTFNNACEARAAGFRVVDDNPC